MLVKAKGGFGNRILSAITGVVLAELGHRTPVIDWREGMYVPAGTNLYPLLFADPVGLDPALWDNREDVAPAIWSGRLASQPIDLINAHFPKSHSNPFVYRKLSVDLAAADPAEPVAVFWSYLPKLLRLRRRLARDRRFAGRSHHDIVHERLMRFFRPIGGVEDAVDRLYEGRRHPVIGVHIRYTDMKTPLERIEAEMVRLRAKMPEASIFLATDNAGVQQRMCAKFNNIFVIEKSMGEEGKALHFDKGHEDPLREARNALIDMWALSRADWLIHSRQSTFSTCAALIGNIPPDRQIDVDARNPRVVLKRWFQSLA